MTRLGSSSYNWRNSLALLIFSFFWLANASAANIKIIDALSTNNLAIVGLTGDIALGDTNELLGLPTNGRPTFVFLESMGGNAAEGLSMAKAINKLGWGTAVIGNSQCMSACALIWIAGKQKLLSKTALVGFHAVYTNDGVSSLGNAVFGAFYGQLGLSDRAIIYLTSAPPSGYNPVTLETAAQLDIQVGDWDKIVGATPTQPLPSAGQATPNTQVSIPNWKIEPGFDIVGFDIPNGSLKTDNAVHCETACEQNAACVAYTFDIRNHVCYMKSGGRLILSSEFALSGIKSQQFNQLKQSTLIIHGKRESIGFDYKSLALESLESCVFECDQDSVCVAFSFEKARRSCMLKNGYSGLTANRAMVSGLKSLR